MLVRQAGNYGVPKYLEPKCVHIHAAECVSMFKCTKGASIIAPTRMACVTLSPALWRGSTSDQCADNSDSLQGLVSRRHHSRAPHRPLAEPVSGCSLAKIPHHQLLHVSHNIQEGSAFFYGVNSGANALNTNSVSQVSVGHHIRVQQSASTLGRILTLTRTIARVPSTISIGLGVPGSPVIII